MKRSTLFYIAGAIALICVMVAAYYLIPGIYHPYISISSGHPALADATKHPKAVLSVHRFYAAAFFVLAAIFAIVAFISRSRRATAIVNK